MGYEAQRGPLPPKGVREDVPLCAELFPLSRDKVTKDWIDIG